MGAAIVLVALVWFDFPARAQGAASTASLKELEGQAQVYRNNIKKQQRNIELMTQELQTNPDHPDTKKLNSFFATAAGVRTQAYLDEPPYIKALIDKLEADPLLKTLNFTTMSKYPNNIAFGHFKVEIERSQKFIAMLRRALKETDAKIKEKKTTPTTAINLADPAPLMGTWKYVKNGLYVIEVSGSDGDIKGVLKESTKPDKNFPWDYKVGTTMFEKGKMQSDGTCKVEWAQYNWKTSSLNKVLGRGNTHATIRLKPAKDAFVVTGLSRMCETEASKERWLNEFGSEFKYSFIKID